MKMVNTQLRSEPPKPRTMLRSELELLKKATSLKRPGAAPKNPDAKPMKKFNNKRGV